MVGRQGSGSAHSRGQSAHHDARDIEFVEFDEGGHAVGAEGVGSPTEVVFLTSPLYASSISRVTGLGRRGRRMTRATPPGSGGVISSSYADESEWTTLPSGRTPTRNAVSQILDDGGLS